MLAYVRWIIMCVYTSMYVYVLYIYICRYVYIYVCMYMCSFNVCTSICMCIYLYMYCIYIYIYVSIYHISAYIYSVAYEPVHGRSLQHANGVHRHKGAHKDFCDQRSANDLKTSQHGMGTWHGAWHVSYGDLMEFLCCRMVIIWDS